jgi:hypothetical protein
VAGLFLVSVAVAGCGSDPKDGDDATDLPGAEELGLAATRETGILRGIVIDEAIRPLAGANVSVQVGAVLRSMDTTASGLFGFDGLAPGDYVVHVGKAGFVDVQTSGTVVAGEDSPPFVKVLMLPDSAYREPYVQTTKISGYIECTGSPVALCGIPNNYRPMACDTHPALCYDNVTSDSTLFWTDFEGNVSFLQAELVWTATSDFSRQLGWNHVAGEGCAGIVGMNNATHGESPLVAPMVPPEVRAPGGETCVLYVGVGAGPPDEATCLPVPLPLLNTVCAGVAIEQSFDVFVHAFYGYLPPAGWTFTADGPAPPPPDS